MRDKRAREAGGRKARMWLMISEGRASRFEVPGGIVL